jgi:hypothetical protein
MPVLTLAPSLEGAIAKGTETAMGDYTLSRDALRAEIDLMVGQCIEAPNMEPDEAMILMSGLLARLVQMHIDIQRVEHVQRELKSVRTQEVDKLMELVRDQYKISSRLIAVRQMDLDLSR